MSTHTPVSSVAPPHSHRPLPDDVPWQAWVVLRALRGIERMASTDATKVPIEAQVTRLAVEREMSKRNVIIGLDWLLEWGLIDEHERTAQGARMVTIMADACLCGAVV